MCLLLALTRLFPLYPGKMTHLCQKLCSVVYPVMEENKEPVKTDVAGEDGTADRTCA